MTALATHADSSNRRRETPPTDAAPSASRHSATAAVELRLLHAASLHRSGGWLATALTGEGVRPSDVEEAIGVTAALARLRESAFDAVVVSHEVGVLDAVCMVEGLRVTGQDEAVIVLVDEPTPDLELQCYEAGADGVCCVGSATARSLLASVQRAVRSRLIVRENRQLHEAERQRLAAEHRDAEQTLADQRQLVHCLQAIADESRCEESPADSPTSPTPNLPDELVQHYRDLLRAYVIMGAGNLASEMADLAELLAASGISAERVIQMHLAALEALLGGLGSRSARHVMNRADLLVLELVAKLADGYRRRYHERTEPCRQRTLPGFAPEDVGPPPPHSPIPAPTPSDA